MTPEYEILRIQKNHNTADFDCGEPTLTTYFRNTARQHNRKGVSAVWVLTNRNYPTTCLGYYTLSAMHIAAGALPLELQRKLPPHDLPGVLLGRLAVAAEHQGKQFGKLLLADAVTKVFGGNPVGAVVIVLDARTDALLDYYARFGFVRSPEPGSLRMFLPRPLDMPTH